MDEAVINSVMERIEDLRGKRDFSLIAIDGRSASGKTSLAGAIHHWMRWPVIHMDDFAVHPEEQRTDDQDAGIAYDRIAAEVLEPLRRREMICFRPHNVREENRKGLITVGAAPMVVVEGTRCLHPQLRDLFDLKIFLDVDKDEQWRRLQERETPERMVRFRTKWIPEEETYMQTYDIPHAADMYFMT